MSEKKNEIERVSPVRMTDNDTGNSYELDFCRESVKFAENRGFKVDDVGDYPATKWPELFYYSFRMHHRNLSRQQTDAILDKFGGMTTSLLGRLVDLYNQAIVSNSDGAPVFQTEEDAAKNSRVTVEF